MQPGPPVRGGRCRINKKNYRPGNNSSREEVEATLIPFSPCPDPRQAKDIPSSRPTKLRIYPDSGATICLGGTKHLRHMGISEKKLLTTSVFRDSTVMKSVITAMTSQDQEIKTGMSAYVDDIFINESIVSAVRV